MNVEQQFLRDSCANECLVVRVTQEISRRNALPGYWMAHEARQCASETHSIKPMVIPGVQLRFRSNASDDGGRITPHNLRYRKSRQKQRAVDKWTPGSHAHGNCLPIWNENLIDILGNRRKKSLAIARGTRQVIVQNQQFIGIDAYQPFNSFTSGLLRGDKGVDSLSDIHALLPSRQKELYPRRGIHQQFWVDGVGAYNAGHLLHQFT